MKKLLLFLSSLFLLVGCNTKNPYDPYASRANEDVKNVYNGDGNDFHVSYWYAPDDKSIDVEKQDNGEYKVFYQKHFGMEYSGMYTTIQGPLADFTYINFVARGTPGKNITLRMYSSKDETEVNNVLGNDVGFSLTEENSIHSLKVKGPLKTRMDLLRKIVIIPEMGVDSGMDTFYINDVYFSKTLPENARWENTGVDTGDTSITVNGWKTEGWTMYSLYPIAGGTGVRYNAAAEWATVEHKLDIKENDNSLRFTFRNVNNSVNTIRFLLRGDVMEHISEGVEYEYDIFYEASIYAYDIGREDEVKPNAEGNVVLELPLTNAINAIGEHHVKLGYRLTLLIESNPDDQAKYPYEREGEMHILGLETYHGEVKVDYYYMIEQGNYVLIDNEFGEKTITYENVSGDGYWPRVNRRVEGATHSSVITMKIKNNGESIVRVNAHAGMANDDRSDSDNNMFYPLWKTNGKSQSGTHYYYGDGGSYDIEPGDTVDIIMSVDAILKDFDMDTKEIKEIASSDTDIINEIQLLVDNCWGDSTKRSGNIDIIEFSIA